jgi:LPXTG-site transpeptidase (sortase) family protein
MLTLITCHPYRKNSQRYVVFCERIWENKWADNKK